MTEEIFKTIDEIIEEMKKKHSNECKSSVYSATYSYKKVGDKKPEILYDIKYEDSNGKKIHKTNLNLIENKKKRLLKFDQTKQNKNIIKQAIINSDNLKNIDINEYLTKDKGERNIYFENGLWINVNKIKNLERFKELISKAIHKGTLKI